MYDPSIYQADFRLAQGQANWSSSVMQKIVSANPNRVAIYIRFVGANGWDLAIGGFLNTNPPVWRYGANETVSFTWIYDGILPSQEWWAQPETPLASAQASWCELQFWPYVE